VLTLISVADQYRLIYTETLTSDLVVSQGEAAVTEVGCAVECSSSAVDCIGFQVERTESRCVLLSCVNLEHLLNTSGEAKVYLVTGTTTFHLLAQSKRSRQLE